MLKAVYNYPENGFKPADELEVGQEYEVEEVHMGGYFTNIYLKGFRYSFNSVQFDFFEDGEPINIYRSKKYNPYLGGADHE